MDDLVIRLGTIAIGLDDASRILGIDVDLLSDRGRRWGHRDGDIAVSLGALCDAKCERDDLSDVRLGAVDFDRHSERLSEEPHGLETLLVVRSTTSDEDLHAVIGERGLVFLKRLDDTLEGGRDIRKVGNTAADDEDLAIGLRGTTGHQVH